MKKKTYRLIGIVFSLSLVGLFSCQNGVESSNGRKFIEGKKISVNWENGEEEVISGFSANVSVYSMNNRKDTSFKFDSSYKISTKLIQGEQYTRLDLLDIKPQGEVLSIISNEREKVLFDTISQEIKYRLPVDNTSKDFSFLQEGIGFGSVNLDKIRTEAKRLSLDVTENTEESTLVIKLPDEFFSTDSVRRLSTKIMFDTVSQTLTNMETVDYRENGSTVTTSVEFVYQECDGKYVKVGSIIKTDTDYNQFIEGINPETPYYNSIDEIPEISEADYEKMKAEGNIFEDDSITFGNPADLSSSETVVEVYENIEINNVDDSKFRLLF